MPRNSSELVSVIIPTFNRAYCLRKAIESVLDQTHSRLEVIVVDDGSSDGTEELIWEYYGSEARVKCVCQNNQGVNAARNEGIRNAHGDYVAFLDSDDAWKPWKLELQLACLEHFRDAGMIWTNMEAIDEKGTIIDPMYLRTMYDAYRYYSNEQLFSRRYSVADVCPPTAAVPPETRVFYGDIFSPMMMGNLVHTSTTIIRRERLEKIGGFREELRPSGGDYDFHLRTCREGPVVYVDIASIRYSVGLSDQLTHVDHDLATAKNFLRTITLGKEESNRPIDLPKKMLDRSFAHAHAWIGECLFEMDEMAAARSHLWQSLRYHARQRRTFAYFMLTVVPRRMSRGLLSSYRELRARTR